MDDKNLDSAAETCNLLASSSTTSIRVAPVKANVASMVDVENMVLRADELAGEAGDGRIADVLVNCAGITRDGWITAQTEEDWDTVVDVNLKGSWMTSKAFATPERTAVLRQGPNSAAIVNVSSVVGKLGNLGQSNYGASKAGVLGLTRSLSKELALSNIRVNAVLPGFITTPMTEAVPEKVRDMMTPKIALRKFGTPENVADLVAFLASERASYLTGVEIEVDGNIGM